MMRTVDLVLVGDDEAARVAAADALRRGQRVLVVLHSEKPRAGQQLRARLRKVVGHAGGRLGVVTGADVVCVDGVGAVEAVVLRRARSGRLFALNASAFGVLARRSLATLSR